jgi:hypothetical protein
MGQLVFQATLGGAVNLVGPNTASTFNLNVPAVASTIATLAAQTFAGTQTFTVDAVVNGLTVGRGAGAIATNTAVGSGALQANTTGTISVALGYQAGYAKTTAGANVAIGYQSQYAGTTGDDNVSVGTYALYNNTGANNVAIGSVALGNAANTGSGIVAVGRDALRNNTSGSNNTAVGYQAGYTNVTGQQNAFFGWQAGYSSTSDSNTYIGSYSGQTTTGLYNSFLGQSSGYLVTTGTKNTIIGRFDGNLGGLDIRTASNYVVLSDGDGNPLISTANSQTVALKGAVPNSGTGITFPATQSASSNANTLDDYEEGTWTPTIYGTSTAGTTTYFQQAGTYTKIGRVVTVQVFLNITNQTGTGDLRLGGLPFTAASGGNTFPCSVRAENLTLSASKFPVFSVQGGATYINMEQNITGGGSMNVIPIDTSFSVDVTATYFV